MATILIVDDSPTETYAMKVVLEKDGFTVITEDNGADGVARAKQDRPDAVIMDIVMPGLNGFQATRQITKDPSTSSIPVVIVTTKDQETDRLWGEKQGAKGYLAKPVEDDVLIATIKKVLDDSAA